MGAHADRRLEYKLTPSGEFAKAAMTGGVK